MTASFFFFFAFHPFQGKGRGVCQEKCGRFTPVSCYASHAGLALAPDYSLNE